VPRKGSAPAASRGAAATARNAAAIPRFQAPLSCAMCTGALIAAAPADSDGQANPAWATPTASSARRSAVPASRARAAAAVPGSSRGSAPSTVAVRSGTAGAAASRARRVTSSAARTHAEQAGQVATWESRSAPGMPGDSPSSRAESASR
jgi:hypothetical protein